MSFIKDLTSLFRSINISVISDITSLDWTVNEFAKAIEIAWEKNTKTINITKYSKSWWDDSCSRDLEMYRSSKRLEDWKQFWSTVKNMKCQFFDLKIQKISNKMWGPWELMNWVNKYKLLAIKMIKYNGQPCIEIDDLWQALHSTFNIAQHHIVDEEVLNELESLANSSWNLFSEEEFTSTLTKCNNLSILGPDKLAWRHLKHILKDSTCLKNIINIANTCLELGYWLSHFKMSTTIIIPKPNKLSYDSPKSFRPIVLLNTLGKLIEKVISDRLQFHMISNNFIYQSQLGGLKFKFTSDVGIALTHFICIG